MATVGIDIEEKFKREINVFRLKNDFKSQTAAAKVGCVANDTHEDLKFEGALVKMNITVDSFEEELLVFSIQNGEDVRKKAVYEVIRRGLAKVSVSELDLK